MAISSINTNIAAYSAQQNIGAASSNIALNVGRLASGNRIQRAADDVAGLAISTSLSIGVALFRTALLSAAQGTSLLQVADGALSGITDMLKRQKTLAAQAGSGALSDVERGYLNQEFQALSDQIDDIASNTAFSGVNLLDGSISGSTSIFTNDNDSDATALASSSFVTVTGSLPTSGDTLTVAGVEFTFTTSDPGASNAVGKISVGSSAANTALNIAAALNDAASTDGRLANLFFTVSAGTVLANWTGGDGAGSVSVTVSSSFTCTANTTANATIAIGSGTNGLGIQRTSFVGSVTGSIFVDSGTTAQQAGQALNLANVEDNADFIGGFGQGRVGLITGAYAGAADRAALSLVVGDITYATDATVDWTPGATSVVTLTFTGADEFGAAKGGSFVVKLNGASTAVGFDSQIELDALIDQINNGLAGVTLQQNRDIINVANGGDVNLGGVNIADTSDFQFDLRASDFTTTTISSLTITAPGAGGTDAVFEAVINGQLYRSIGGIGNQIGKNEVIALQNVNDSSKVFTITTGNNGLIDSTSTTMDLATQAKADAIAASLSTAIGIDAEGGTGLQFQIGDSAEQQLNVTIGDARTESLYGGQSLSIDTQSNAAAAATALDDAVAAITGLRAGVGSLQSRFGFASANLQIIIQNQEAARAEIGDTDIAAESTLYATNQVKLQAGISVLAQSNQQVQSLLKLIG